jgi:hypothetical protein
MEPDIPSLDASLFGDVNPALASGDFRYIAADHEGAIGSGPCITKQPQEEKMLPAGIFVASAILRNSDGVSSLFWSRQPTARAPEERPSRKNGA